MATQSRITETAVDGPNGHRLPIPHAPQKAFDHVEESLIDIARRLGRIAAREAFAAAPSAHPAAANDDPRPSGDSRRGPSPLAVLVALAPLGLVATLLTV